MKKILSNTILLIFVTLTVFSCDNSTSQDSPGEQIQKSGKRGLAFNLSDPQDFAALKNGVSWWYNWHFKTVAPENYYTDYQMEFIPMLWGGNSSQDFAEAKQFILNHPDINYLLVLNEPNLTDQANQAPLAAARNWVSYENFINELSAEGRTVYLVGPAMNWGTMENYWDPVDWLDTFYEAYRNIHEGNDPKIDYLAFHWYDYGLATQLDRLQKYGKKIWITEMANWNPQINSYAKQAQQMTEMVSLCESRDDVFRYAWFIGRGSLPDNHFTYLFNEAPGDLNSLGELYLSLPYAD